MNMGATPNQEGPKTINRAKLLLVEGPDDRVFLQELAKRLNKSDDLEIRELVGKARLNKKLEAFRKVDGFEGVTSLGIVLDADENAASAFRSVQGALKAAGLPVPAKPVKPEPGPPRVSVFIMPDNTNPGELETLCLRTVKDDPAMRCVEDLMACLETRALIRSKSPEKARAQAFLASREDPQREVGLAAVQKHWRLDDPALDDLKQFILALSG